MSALNLSFNQIGHFFDKYQIWIARFLFLYLLKQYSSCLFFLKQFSDITARKAAKFDRSEYDRRYFLPFYKTKR